VAGSVAVYHATRDSRAGIASSYCSKGYPCFRVPTEPTLEQDIRKGQKDDEKINEIR
jgi:hypothetical protein